jgi:hypothetical protein
MVMEVFLSLIVTTSVGCLLSIARMFYKSKCKNIKCCGLVIERDVAEERKEFEFDRIHPPQQMESRTNLNDLV